MPDLVRKYTIRASESGDPLEYVMSDDSIDRYGDIIDPKGWDLTDFKKNPIALFGHNSDFPIGKWSNVRVTGGKLLGRLKLVERGISQRIDEIIGLVEAGILRAVSVGFRPLEAEPIDENAPWAGLRFTKSELLETSIVSIPANPNALAIAKAMHISEGTQSLIFGELARETPGVLAVRSLGVSADPPAIRPTSKDRPMTLAERIVTARANLVSLKDQLNTLVTQDNHDVEQSEELSGRIDTAQRSLAALEKAEQQIGETSAVVQTRAPAPIPAAALEVTGRVFPTAETGVKKSRPSDLIFRSIVCQLHSHLSRDGEKAMTPWEAMRARYGDDRETKAMLDVVTRAATNPATTTTSGWASQLVQTAIVDFIDQLQPLSVYPGLAARGPRFSFGRNGVISIPSRSATPTVAGGFIAEGAPIPVKQGAFGSVSITPRKMGVITTFTREIANYSTPSIEALVRSMILDDTAVSIDTVLLSASAASTTSPAGLRNGVSGLTATAGGGFAALVGDIRQLIGVLVAANSLRAPVFIMNPADALAVALTQNAGGDFPFQAEINQGRLQGYPVLLSTTQTAKTVLLVDAADFFSATSDEPVFAVSDTATLHMEDTTPLQIGTAGAPNTVAAPVRSMFQTDSVALRMTMDINWAMRRTGVITYVTAVTW